MSTPFSPIQTQKEYHDEKESEFIHSHGEVPPPTPMIIRKLPMLNDNCYIHQCDRIAPQYILIEPKKEEKK